MESEGWSDKGKASVIMCAHKDELREKELFSEYVQVLHVFAWLKSRAFIFSVRHIKKETRGGKKER